MRRNHVGQHLITLYVCMYVCTYIRTYIHSFAVLAKGATGHVFGSLGMVDMLVAGCSKECSPNLRSKDLKTMEPIGNRCIGRPMDCAGLVLAVASSFQQSVLVICWRRG
jgi:hypothetical protein